MPRSRATATASEPIDAGWSTTTSTRPRPVRAWSRSRILSSSAAAACRELGRRPGRARWRGALPCQRRGRGRRRSQVGSSFRFPFAYGDWSQVWRRMPAPTLRRDLPTPRRSSMRRWPCPYQRSSQPPVPVPPGSCLRQGQSVMPEPATRTPCLWGHEEGNGSVTSFRC